MRLDSPHFFHRNSTMRFLTLEQLIAVEMTVVGWLKEMVILYLLRSGFFYQAESKAQRVLRTA